MFSATIYVISHALQPNYTNPSTALIVSFFIL